MDTALANLVEAENKAEQLFAEIEKQQLVQAGKTEKELNEEVFQLALRMFGIEKYWHKRIIRAGKNTLLPYRHNPPNLTLQEDDILFFDFGPIFDDWEADVGKTYVVGQHPKKLKLKQDVEKAWHLGKAYYNTHKNTLTGAEFYAYIADIAKEMGWIYGNEHCGHLVGKFPHEKIQGEKVANYIHPDNHRLMSELDDHGNPRYWILEIHFIDEELEIGGFFEQLVS